PPMLDDLGLKDAVQSLLSDYEQHTGIAVKMDLKFERRALPDAVSENVYRILQEALTNVSRHARAPEVSVGLHVLPDQVSLMVREALAQILEESGCIRVVGQAADGPGAVDVATRARPDVLVLDYSMPGLGAPEILSSLRQRLPDLKVLVLTVHENIHYCVQAL